MVVTDRQQRGKKWASLRALWLRLESSPAVTRTFGFSLWCSRSASWANLRPICTRRQKALLDRWSAVPVWKCSVLHVCSWTPYTVFPPFLFSPPYILSIPPPAVSSTFFIHWLMRFHSSDSPYFPPPSNLFKLICFLLRVSVSWERKIKLIKSMLSLSSERVTRCFVADCNGWDGIVSNKCPETHPRQPS